MLHTFPIKGLRVLLLSMLFSLSAYAQLSDFTLTVTPTAQTCLGNGSLAFSVSGNNPSATMSYSVFLLPNVTTPLTIVTTNTVGGLTAGTYQVVATQTLGGQSNTSTQTVTINNNVVPLQFTPQKTDVRCGNDGVITVVVTSGTAVSYEITAGPVTAPVQTSPVFNNLPAGTYQIRVFNSCGEAVVSSILLAQLIPGLTVSPGGVGDELTSCTTIGVENEFNVGANLNIFYPLTAQFTVFPPGGGAPIVVNGTATGNPSQGVAAAIIPFYYDQEYTYNVVITDACGNTYIRNNNIVNVEMSIDVTPAFPPCEERNFTLTPVYGVAPFTVTFTNAPAGFDPALMNPEHPTFNGEETVYGLPGTPVPEGQYSVSITDACGHTATEDFEVIVPPTNPTVTGEADCGSTTGTVTIKIPPRQVTLVSITSAPPAYTAALPSDVSAGIADGQLEIELPLGDYVFYIEDSCGDNYTQNFTLEVTGGGPDNLSFLQRPGCDEGYGSIKMQVTNDIDLVQVTITAAPAAFPQALPFDGSSYLANGDFYMNGLPEGSYTFSTVDVCGTVRQGTYVINGYHETVNNFTVIPLCGAFHLQVEHTATTGVYLPTFFLQKYYPGTNTWGHPVTGVTYTDGTLPSTANSLLLTNNAINYNILSIGQFRVLKVYYIYSNGSSASLRCMHEVDNFVFDDAPLITDAYTFPCAANTSEVIIEASGVEPLTYSITLKDGQPFVINNGTSNLFSGLESATYNFMVTDMCGNIRNIQFDINALDPIEIEAQGFCEGQNSALVIPEFDFLDYSWYEQGNPGTILSTTGTLTFPSFNSANDAGTYVLDITYGANPSSCLNQTLQYTVQANVLPNAGPDASASLCNEGTVLDLDSYLTAPFDAGGTWAETTASGALTGNQFNTAGVPGGNYVFTYTVLSAECSISDTAIINIQLKDVPAAPVLNPVAPVCEGDAVQLTADPVAGASYQWTGPNGFTSTLQNPLISPSVIANSGTYTATVTVNGCTSPAASVTVTVSGLANAGPDATLSICNQGTVLDLNDYLTAPFDAGGTWAETTASGALAGSQFNTSGLAEDTYTFTYTVNGPCGDTDDAIITIALKDIPVAPVLAPVADVCAGDDVQLTADPVAGASYQWTGPNGFTSTLQNPTIFDAEVSDTGNYTAYVTVNGCTSPIATVSVTVYALPQAGPDATIPVCNEGNILDLNNYLTAPFDAGGTWTEVSASGALTGSQFDTSGLVQDTYVFTYTVSSLCGATDDATITIPLYDIPAAPVLAPVADACAGDDVQLMADPVAGASYEWTGPNGFTSTVQNPVISQATPANSGNYSAFVTINGCPSAITTVSVLVKPVPQFTINGTTLLCDGQSLTLSVVPGNFTDAQATYNWFEDGASLGVTTSGIEIFQPGTYEVVVTVDGCSTTHSLTVNLNTNAFDFDLEAGCVDEAYMISVVNLEGIIDAQFDWTGPDNYSYSGGPDANITKLETGEYTVTVTSLEGCSVTQSITVDNTNCEIPKGISPNGDEWNNNFDLSNLDVQKLVIFNRYGLQVYEKENYVDEWYGQSPAGELPTGTYFYVVTLSAGAKKTGWVYLQREVK